jgi:hypothetical protein
MISTPTTLEITAIAAAIDAKAILPFFNKSQASSKKNSSRLSL